MAPHARFIHDADLAFPIILSSDGRIMDRMHRVTKAVMENLTTVLAKRFVTDPEPDYMDVRPDDLPY